MKHDDFLKFDYGTNKKQIFDIFEQQMTICDTWLSAHIYFNKDEIFKYIIDSFKIPKKNDIYLNESTDNIFKSFKRDTNIKSRRYCYFFPQRIHTFYGMYKIETMYYFLFWRFS